MIGCDHRRAAIQEPALTGTRNARLFSERDWYLNCEKTNKLRLEDITVVDPKLLIFPGGSTVTNHDRER